jgi:hypothetical protein
MRVLKEDMIMKNPKKSTIEKEQKLMDLISGAKKKLEKLQERKKSEIGKLAFKHGLHQFDIQELDLAFSKLSKELANV